jgi:branched-chain amino acid transport system ATP-binding protein
MKNFTILEVNDIDVSYGYVDVLTDIHMKIEKGSCVALVGLNGAGKSTLLKAIAGIVKPKKGTIIFENKEIQTLSPWQISRQGIIYVPEGRRVFTKLTVKENLLLGCYFKKKESYLELLNEVYRLFPRLKERENQVAGTLSGGEQQMLAIARSLMAEPKLLLLDEVAQGLSPLVGAEIYKKVKEINKLGVTILLVDENVKRSLKISHYAYVMESGRIVLQGPSSEIIKKEDFLKAYFGVSV